MAQYCIADVTIDIDTDSGLMTDRCGLFQASEPGPPDLNIVLRQSDRIEKPEGEVLSTQVINWILRSGGHYLYTTEMDFGQVLTLADVDTRWQQGKISYLNHGDRRPEVNYSFQTGVYTHILIGVLFRYHLLHRDGIVLHASTIDWNGKGILFSAPSGTGKSTHVRLWQQLYGSQVRVLNDDTPAIRIKEGVPWVYGTPWAGSSDIHCNGSAPAAAIVVLEQAPENQIRRLSPQEAILRLMPRAFLPYFDQDMLDLACGILERIVAAVPVYLLKCRPDFEAVEMVHQCITA
ncbi:MAG: hypothetical protein ACM3QZ_09975 [Solirubrobacterales bacterium]